ncbi:MAG TPA: glycoside hydrolase family 2 TIM barrel-domain containing protein [Solirubrobacteraceae bacterium]|nr:glycoside hydrolase family 2 TIM barrel-domain containing protein [Solirubrobacteraceae bacterium]
MAAAPRRLLLFVTGGLLLLAIAAATTPSHGSHRHAAPTRADAVLPATVRPPAAIPLTSGWRYLADPHNLGIAEDWGTGGAADLQWTPVSIPNDFNVSVSSGSDTGMVGWYEVRFAGPPVSAERSWRVAFESVRRDAEVWLNGHRIGSNSDPYAPFSLPATSLKPGAENVLIVRVDNFRDGSLPEDWWNWGGIVGPVTLEPAGRLALADLGVMPELGCAYRCGELLIQGRLTNTSRSALRPEIVVSAAGPNGTTSTARSLLRRLDPGASTAVSLRMRIGRPLALWSPRSPALYSVRVDVAAGGRVEQTQSLRTGMRTATVRRGVLYLNGRRLWLHGASIHEDMQGVGAALPDGAIDTIVSELRSLGANVTRAHYLLSPRLLDALDAAGILVWAQPPVDHAVPELRNAAGRARALALLRSTLLGDRNHPSVIIDSVGNELTPTPDSSPGTRAYLDAAIPLARRLNPGVPVALDTYCYPNFPQQRIYAKLNVLGISSYFGWYTGPRGHSVVSFDGLGPFLARSHRRYPTLALVVSEFGAESLFNGPPTVKGSFAFQDSYLQRTYSVLSGLPFMNGGVYWTLREFAERPGWTGGVTLPAGDTPDGLHHKGLIAYDGTAKPAFAVAQQLFSTVPQFAR